MMTMVRLNYDDKVNNTFNKDLSIESDLESVSSGVNKRILGLKKKKLVQNYLTVHYFNLG